MIRRIGRFPNVFRLWFGGDWPMGVPHGSGAVAVEWAGQTGHPSSYALLGGWPSKQCAVTVPVEGSPFADSLAGAGDDVHWGLPDEYRQAVEVYLADRRGDIELAIAAHGRVGSSQYVFRRIGSCLAMLIRDPTLLKLQDEAVFTALAEALAGA